MSSAGLRGWMVLLLATLLVVSPLAADRADGAELRLAGIGEPANGPAPDYPVPADPGMVFYLQRSANANTVVYTARFGNDGALDPKQPISGFWRRYNAGGEVRDLSMLERKLAYGVSAEPRGDGSFEVRFRAAPDLRFVLEPRGQGKAVLTFAPRGKPIELSHGYVETDESGLVPEVTGLRLYGHQPDDGRPVEVVFGVSGGTIPG